MFVGREAAPGLLGGTAVTVVAALLEAASPLVAAESALRCRSAPSAAIPCFRRRVAARVAGCVRLIGYSAGDRTRVRAGEEGGGGLCRQGTDSRSPCECSGGL